jgi:hypothetical protein
LTFHHQADSRTTTNKKAPSRQRQGVSFFLLLEMERVRVELQAKTNIGIRVELL